MKNSPAKQEIQVQSLGREDPIEKEMATCSCILTREIPQTEQPGRLQSMGLQSFGHDLETTQRQQQTLIKKEGGRCVRKAVVNGRSTRSWLLPHVGNGCSAEQTFRTADPSKQLPSAGFSLPFAMSPPGTWGPPYTQNACHVQGAPRKADCSNSPPLPFSPTSSALSSLILPSTHQKQIEVLQLPRHAQPPAPIFPPGLDWISVL